MERPLRNVGLPSRYGLYVLAAALSWPIFRISPTMPEKGCTGGSAPETEQKPDHRRRDRVPVWDSSWSSVAVILCGGPGILKGAGIRRAKTR